MNYSKQRCGRVVALSLLIAMVLPACRSAKKPNAYALDRMEQPTCAIVVRFYDDHDEEKFVKCVEAFAALYKMPTTTPAKVLPNGQMIPPLYGTEDVVLAPFIVHHGADGARGFGQVRLHILTKAFSLSEFHTMGERLMREVTSAFPEQVQWSEDPNEGRGGVPLGPGAVEPPKPRNPKNAKSEPK